MSLTCTCHFCQTNNVPSTPNSITHNSRFPPHHAAICGHGPQELTARQDMGVYLHHLSLSGTGWQGRKLVATGNYQNNIQRDLVLAMLSAQQPKWARRLGCVSWFEATPVQLAICNEELWKHLGNALRANSGMSGFNTLPDCLHHIRKYIRTASEPHPNHIQTTSEPHSSHIRATCETIAEAKGKEVSSIWDPYYEARHDCINDVDACNWKWIPRLPPRAFLCVLGVHRKYLMKAPELQKMNTCRGALCNRCPVQLGSSFSKNNNVRAIILASIAQLYRKTTFCERSLCLHMF